MQIATYDVFAGKPYCGNQAAVVRIGKGRLSDRQLVALAEELSLAETASLRVQNRELIFRFATTDRIISRCGHATLAGAADHIFTTLLPRRSGRYEWSGRYRVGTCAAEWRARLTAGRRRRHNTNGLEVAVAWPDLPTFATALPPGPMYRAVGLDSTDSATELPLCVYNSGNFNALVPVRTVAALERAAPNLARLKDFFKKFRLPNKSSLTDVHLYCVQRRSNRSREILLRCRNVFPYGLLEETATGTAYVAAAAALANHLPALQGGNRVADFHFDQGKGKRRGKIRVHWRPRPGEMPEIWLEGRVFPIIRGEFVSLPFNITATA
jgi:PhzF family phenazine biosynthesis protein